MDRRRYQSNRNGIHKISTIQIQWTKINTEDEKSSSVLYLFTSFSFYFRYYSYEQVLHLLPYQLQPLP